MTPKEIISRCNSIARLISSMSLTAKTCERDLSTAFRSTDPAIVENANQIPSSRYLTLDVIRDEAYAALAALELVGGWGRVYTFMVDDEDFTQLHVDLYNKATYTPSAGGTSPWGTGSGNGLSLTARNAAAPGIVTPNPWLFLAVGDAVLIEKCSLGEMTGAGSLLEYKNVQGFLGTIVGIVEDADGNHQLLFDEDVEDCDSAASAMLVPSTNMSAKAGYFFQARKVYDA
jgi:hypothetical protein